MFVANNLEIQWTKSSMKHRSVLSELVEHLKTEPSKATKIGAWIVCFDERFSIGRGNNSTKVYLGLSEDGCEVAVKSLDLRTCEEVGENEKSILTCRKVKKEKHIVNYHYYHQVDPEKAYLVLDLHEQSLQDYVKSEERPVEVLRKEGPSIIRQILYGVKTLHDGDPEILHRDLKPSNILVNMEGEMVLADFGISRILPKDETTCKSGVSGTEGWMAVESLPTEDDEDDDSIPYEDIKVRYKTKSDIQVVGMLSYYILTRGKHPYGRRTHRSYNISKGYFDLKDISDPCAKDLITWMLHHDPAKRPNVHECLKHPYLRTPEENFTFVTLVGNEREIKINDATENVVKELNKLPAFTGWLTKIDACVIKYMKDHAPKFTYKSNVVTHLLRFIRNMDTHWRDKPPPANVQTTVVGPQEYFERIFPTLAVEVYRIIREDPNWTTREKLMKFFHQPECQQE